jgi:hypothetical protein
MNPADERPVPQSVRYAGGLLKVQAVIWGLTCALSVLGVAENAAAHLLAGSAWFALAAVLGGTFAMLKWRLARGLPTGAHRTRKTAIGVEIAMACFGGLGALSLDPSAGAIAGLIGLPFLAGTGLSLAAAIGLMRPPARQYFEALDREPAELGPAPGSGDAGQASFWRLVPLPRGI